MTVDETWRGRVAPLDLVQHLPRGPPDLKDVGSEYSAQQSGRVLTSARRYRLMAFRSISVMWSQRPEDTRVLPLSACSSPHFGKTVDFG